MRPNDEQLEALRYFSVLHGREWKHELLNQWRDGRDTCNRDGALLRQIRNRFGPQWLESFTFD